MLLALDIGNTNIVIGIIEEGNIEAVFRMATEHSFTEDQYAMQVHSILRMNKIDADSFEHSIISSVVPTLTDTMRRAIFKITGKKALIVSPGIKTGLNILIENPTQLGSDLVTDAVAAIAEYPLPAVVVDMGTATTFSVIAENGDYLGGVIVPGLMVSAKTLAQNTSQLPRVGIDAPENVIGKNTVDCIKSGLVFGTASMIDGLIDKFSAELDKKPTVIATGGLAGVVVPYCKHEIIYDPELLLKGLYLIYKKNKHR